MRRRLMQTLAGLVLASFAVAANAQDASTFPVLDAPSEQVAVPLLTVDFETLFTGSAFGQRIAQDFTQQGETLGMESRRIAAALREEELALTRQRATMAPNVFRTEAEAFDAKAQAIRRAQDAKEAALDSMLSDGREQFLNATLPVLGQLMFEHGAFAIMDRRTLLVSLSSLDITQEAIERIDAAIGDGTESVLQPIPAPDIAPEETPAAPFNTAPDAPANPLPDVGADN